MKPFNVRLGWTRGRERPELFGPDHQIQLRPSITGSRVGAVIAIGLAIFLWFALPESHVFLLGVLVAGALIGIALWWKHR